MKLEDQVVSLELAKKLKELGVKQESYLHWVDIHDSWFLGSKADYSRTEQERMVSAYTVAELGEMLPQYFSTTKVEPFLWEGSVLEVGNIEEFSGDTEADSRAKMLIYLLENKLINHENIT